MEKELEGIIKTLENKKEYKIYLLAPRFIMRYMDKLKIVYDKEKVKEKLTYFWIGLKAVDLEMEKKDYNGKEYLNTILGKKTKEKSFGILITKKLSKYLKTKKAQKLSIRLYQAVIKEKNPRNIKELIKSRKETGNLLAIFIKELIKNNIKKIEKEKKFNEFLHESMKMCQLIDSYVDLYEDYKKGELKFKPTKKDKHKLRRKLLKYTLKNTPRYPLIGISLIFGIKYLRKMKT